ncbi:MAG: MFS transporter [Jatrophihabitans sp.]|uniref:MFS transporter n=1 Tax=Jatrophihabitans sp. TaxID=1932789 RepID=UPI003F81B38D
MELDAVTAAGPSRAARSDWRLLAAFALVGAATQLLWLTFAPITSDIAKHYGVSETAIGWLANVFPLWYVVLAIPAGLLLDRSLRGGLALGAVLTALGGLVRLVTDDYGAALAGQTLVAIAQPLVLNAITGVAAQYLAPDDRPKGIAFGSASTFAGMIAAFVLATALPLHGLLVVCAVVGVVAALAPVWTLRRAPGFGSSVASGSASLAAFRDAWRAPLVRRLCLVVFVPFGTFTALTTWAEPLLKPAGISSDQAGVLLLVNIVLGVAGAATLPVWAVRHGAETRLMVVAVGVTGVACVLLAVAPSFPLALVAFAAFGFLLLATLPVVLEITERAAGAAEGTTAGLVWLSGQLGALALTGAIGGIVHHAATSFAVLAALTLLGVVPVRLLRPHLEGTGGDGGTADRPAKGSKQAARIPQAP